MRNTVHRIVAVVGLFVSCTYSSKNAEPQTVQRDRSITSVNAYTGVFFDSFVMEKFLRNASIGKADAAGIRNFYNSRNYQYAWFFKEGIADHASTFLRLQDEYMAYSRDSSIYNPYLEKMVDSLSNISLLPDFSDSELLKVELMLTWQFFRYAPLAYQGNTDVNVRQLEWFIPRKKIDVVSVLDSIIENRGANLEKYEPVYRQYHLLENFLIKYYELEKRRKWGKIKFERKSYRRGDTSLTISSIKERLVDFEDLPPGDTLPVFDSAMETAVKAFQRRNGLKEDGIIGTVVMKELNIDLNEYIRTILINMERIRWMPAQPKSDFLLVNIPEFRLHVYENGKHAFAMKVVVGTAAHNTVIFAGTLKYVVFSPYWNVPPGILRNEILPAIRRNPNYLASHDMEWHGNTVRQRPGPSNSLGLIKFVFPNSYNIYLHDTPAKDLFNEDTRTFSHGCIRISEPKKLADFVFRNDPNWPPDKIEDAMNKGVERYVTLKDPVTVFVGYFTAWVDPSGRINFRNDVYGHDREMANHLFAK